MVPSVRHRVVRVGVVCVPVAVRGLHDGGDRREGCVEERGELAVARRLAGRGQHQSALPAALCGLRVELERQGG